MPSNKHNLITAIAAGLITSLLNVTSFGDTLFANRSSSNACIMVLSKLIPLFSIPLFYTAKVTICDVDCIYKASVGLR